VRDRKGNSAGGVYIVNIHHFKTQGPGSAYGTLQASEHQDVS